MTTTLITDYVTDLTPEQAREAKIANRLKALAGKPRRPGYSLATFKGERV
jgi:hypothetical protein